MHTCLWPDSQILFRHKWWNLSTASFSLRYFEISYSRSFLGLSFFICGSGFRLKFFRIALLLKRLQLDSKIDLSTIGLILEFWLKYGFFVDFRSIWTEICKNCSSSFLFWRHLVFSMSSLRGILVCSLTVLVCGCSTSVTVVVVFGVILAESVDEPARAGYLFLVCEE